MTEQQRYDELDQAIDTLIPQGRLTPTGDAELDALVRVASGLRGLPDPDFRARLPAELFPQPARRPWLAFIRRNSMTARIQQVARRPVVLAPLAFAAGVAAAILIAVLVVVPLVQRGASEQAFGLLPAPGEGGQQGGGGDVIPPPPGAMGTITYTLPPDLSLPASAPAYRLRSPEVTAERVQEIGQRLGIDGTVEPIVGGDGSISGYQVSDTQACPSDLPDKSCEPTRIFQMLLEADGFVSYAVRFDTLAPATAAPTEEEARAAAEAWLRLTGLTGDEPVTLTVNEPGGKGPPDARVVGVTPAQAGKRLPGLAQPHIDITVVGGGQVHTAFGTWASVEAEASYPLRSAEQLVGDLQALRGDFYLFDLHRLALDTLFADLTQDASATVESAELAYASGVAANGQAYLVPIYLVRGHLTQPGLAEPEAFTTWVPATDTASPATLAPGLPEELTELVAARDALPVPPGETFRGSFWGDPGIITSYFVEDGPEAVAEFYRRELTAQGWQTEVPPTLRTTSALTFAQQNTIRSFVEGDVRVAVVLSPNEKDPARGATFLHVVVEPR